MAQKPGIPSDILRFFRNPEVVPAFTAASWKALSTESDTERATVTEAWSVASVGWPAAEAVAWLLTVAGATEEATE